MATPIRVIPTLHGEEARKFIERAEWVEAHPGQTKVDPEYIKKMKAFLRDMNLNSNDKRRIIIPVQA